MSYSTLHHRLSKLCWINYAPDTFLDGDIEVTGELTECQSQVYGKTAVSIWVQVARLEQLLFIALRSLIVEELSVTDDEDFGSWSHSLGSFFFFESLIDDLEENL